MMAQDVERLYELLRELERRIGGPRTLAAATSASGWPDRGVYFFFEFGEVGADGGPRVVRVGTHALRGSSRTTLWKRLNQHRGALAGRSAGGGNHRGSIFRLHVGEALMARDGPFVGTESWGRGGNATTAIRAGEVEHERRVSTTIGAMPLLRLPVDDEPGPQSDRGVIERACISILASSTDAPSTGWLGRWSTRSAIRSSGLWNVNHVGEVPPPHGLDVLERWVVRAGVTPPSYTPTDEGQ